MTKYYIGYAQGDNNYVYVSNINKTTINVTVVIEDAIDFNDEQMAKNMLEYVKVQVTNQEFKVLKIVTKIDEIE